MKVTNFPFSDQAQVMVSDGQGGSSLTTINFTVLSDTETFFLTDANSNRGTLVGTLLVQDEFHFYNSVIDNVSSGVDYIDLFYSTIDGDTIKLSGDYFAVEDIVANGTFNETNEQLHLRHLSDRCDDCFNSSFGSNRFLPMT